MSRKAELTTAIFSLGCALSIGFMMQSGEVAELRYGSADSTAASSTQIVGEPPVTPVRFTEIETTQLEPLQVRSIKLMSGQVVAPPRAVLLGGAIKSYADPSETEDDALAAGLSGPETKNPADCPVSMSADPIGGAMLSLNIKAACLAGREVVVMHDALTFRDVLSETGELAVFVPALSEMAVVEATFATGEKVQARAEVKTLALYDRIILQWRGATDISMNLRAFVSAQDKARHAWSVTEQRLSEPSKSGDGYFSSLGKRAVLNPQLAEIYTAPATAPATAPNSDQLGNLTIEAEITADICGQDISVEATRIIAGKKVNSQDLALPVPDCDEIGNILVLNNFLQDLTLASK